MLKFDASMGKPPCPGREKPWLLDPKSLCHLLEVTSLLIHQTVSLEACTKGSVGIRPWFLRFPLPPASCGLTVLRSKKVIGENMVNK